MGPNNPWSPDWRPDTTGRRLATIRLMRWGALIAAILYLLVGVGAAVVEFGDRAITGIGVDLGVAAGTVAAAAAIVGLPGVALLGAGLAPTTIGSRIDAVVAGLALAIGAPVAAVTSMVITGFLVGLVFEHDLTAGIVRAAVNSAVGIAPVVAVAAAIWVIVLRRLGRRVVPSSG
jgi:hypothetical protein